MESEVRCVATDFRERNKRDHVPRPCPSNTIIGLDALIATWIHLSIPSFEDEIIEFDKSPSIAKSKGTFHSAITHVNISKMSSSPAFAMIISGTGTFATFGKIIMH